MTKRISRNSSSKSNKSHHPVIRVILFPFRIVFRAASWIVEMIIKGFDKIFNSFHAKDLTMNAAKRLGRKIETYYSPFKIIETISGKFSKFEDFVSKNPSTIGIILGARGSGKSAVGLKFLENFHTLSKKNMYAMGFKQENLPEWIHCVDSLNDIENDSYVLIDEGGILFSARKSFSDGNKLLSELLLIARHRDLSVLFISQNSANLEINAIRQTDYLILKPSSLLQMDFERKKIKEIYDSVEHGFKKHSSIKGLSYIYSEKFRGFVSNPLPSFWNLKVSKSFKDKK